MVNEILSGNSATDVPSPALSSRAGGEGEATTHTHYTYKADKVNAATLQGRQGR
jgi:hypothetical protein